MKKRLKGAASFYIVAFSTLILVIIVLSFAGVVVSELTRTSNSDLSQSAYDSAMAGVEDAKLALYNYRNCLERDKTGKEVKPNNDLEVSCNEIFYYMNLNNYSSEEESCKMVGKILNRNDDIVSIEESNVGNNMAQFYTCVKLDDTLGDYLGELSPSNMTKVVKPNFDVINASGVKKIRLKWYSDKNMGDNDQLNYTNFNGTSVVYKGLNSGKLSTPPTVFVAMMQTGPSFNMSDFDTTSGAQTDRGMVYLTPVNNKSAAKTNKDNNYKGAYSEEKSTNYIDKNGFLKSNDKTSVNLPYAVFCDSGGDYACSVTIELPDPKNGARNNETFRIIVGLPYGAPDTDFSLEFLCNDGASGCEKIANESGGKSSRAIMKGTQVAVDSTGKANDIFRRIEVRLEDTSDPLSVMGPLELLGNSGESTIKKNVLDNNSGADPVKCEWNFYGDEKPCSESDY
ncbi:hypothetical protein IKF92_03595 [Candidatus Saccharibacteria bacterium]|nr:hypothetical protein [Candidatus Saccharibacteria bacterium]